MNITHTLRRGTQINRHGIAVICGERQKTYAQLQERVSKFAGALHGLGLSSGDRVAILALNSDRYIEYYFGVAWAGGVHVPLNFRLAPAELIYMLNHSESSMLLVDDAFAGIVPALLDKSETIKHIIFIGDGLTPDGFLNYEEILAVADPVPEADKTRDDLASIMYTGGTTGTPKGVMITHDNILAELLAITSIASKPSPVHATIAPLFHAAALPAAYLLALKGRTHVVLAKFDIGLLLQSIQTHYVTSTTLVPTMIGMLVNHPAVEDHDLSSLERITYGASPMPPAVLSKAMDILPDCEFLQGYGQTESTSGFVFLEPEYHVMDGQLAGKIKSAGRGAVNADVRIVDPGDNEVPRGEIGEVVMRGPLVMKGYWKEPEHTAQTIRDGWLHTGDAGYMDEDGFIFLVDRMKDMIISGGENIYSIEVENAIFKHPAVEMCAVIGIPDGEWGESVHAVVMTRAGGSVTEEEIISHCQELIAHYKCPRSVTITRDPLPLSGAGKVLKRELRHPYWEGYERRVN